MSNTRNNFTGFADLLKRGLGDLLAPDATDFVMMMAEDGVIEFPYAPPGGVHSLKGRAELGAYLERLGDVIKLLSFSEPHVHRTTDPDVVILEFTAQGRGVKTGNPYEQVYISVVTVRDGYIEHYRDYWNPLIGRQEIGALGAANADQPAEVRP